MVPQIIKKFPNFDKKTVVIEPSMINQIVPHGFQLSESEEKPESNFYCLVLDNQLKSAILNNIIKFFYKIIKDINICV